MTASGTITETTCKRAAPMANSFSQRLGLKPVKTTLQKESMDDELRNRLWNSLCIFYWDSAQEGRSYGNHDYNAGIDTFLKRLWHNYFKRPTDTIKQYWFQVSDELRTRYFHMTWNEVYDFIEFVAYNHPSDEKNERFMQFCNRVLEEDLVGYRFVDGLITPLTSPEEIKEIEDAVNSSVQPVKDHLVRAMELFSDRKAPDYRNSIKESISAVEALCGLITGAGTLGQALKELEKKGLVLHPALKDGFGKLYGYANDAGGIRHALQEESSVGAEDARFMLISCSAFINYLTTKADKAKIRLAN